MYEEEAPGTYIDDIAPDVIGVLEKLRFFEKLDDHFCPVNDVENRVDCHSGSFRVSARILRDLGMDSDELDDVFAVLQSRGASCDCEILYNVVEQSRLKAKYWKARHAHVVDSGRNRR
jgi:hypothetical protein